MTVLQARSWLPRTEGSARLEFVSRNGRTHLDVLHQKGAARARFPHSAEARSPEAVLLNTAGGLTGGGRLQLEGGLRGRGRGGGPHRPPREGDPARRAGGGGTHPALR